MASKRTEYTVIRIMVALAGAVAISAATDQPSEPHRTEVQQLLYDTYIKDGVPPGKADRFAREATTDTPGYRRAQADKAEQERALYCAGRPESC